MPILKRSEIVERTLKFEGQYISFKDYPLQRQIIDTAAEEKMIISGRQVAKSMLVMEEIFVDVMTRPYWKQLYVAPIVEQVKTFSQERIGDRIEESDAFKKFYTDSTCLNNVFTKTFKKGRRIYFRAQTQLKMSRGLSVNKIYYDEVQDILSDTILIMDETQSGRLNNAKWYTGTPLTMQNYIEDLWSKSQKMTPMMICPAGHHQPPYLYNIAEDGVRCYKCKEKIDIRQTYFKRMGDKDSPLCAFWIPQIVLPLHAENKSKWDKLYRKFKTYPPDKFKNEIMGISSGQGAMLVTEQEIKNCCIDFRTGEEFEMWEERLAPHLHGVRELWCGIDWAVTNRVSYTILTIGGFDYETGRFRIVFGKKFTESDPLKVVDEIVWWIARFGVENICADWGAGHWPNRMLETKLSQPVYRVMYTGERIPIEFDSKAGFYKASRTLTLLNTFNQFKEGRIHVYEWTKFKEMADMILAEYFEATEDSRGNNGLRFDHNPENPDDYLHAASLMINVFMHLRDKDRQIFK